MSLRIYGIYREKALSPGKVAEDAAILEAVLARLAARGCDIGYLSADDLPPEAPAAALVLHMAQGPQAIEHLARWEEEGLLLINSPQAIKRCLRRSLFPLLAGLDFPYPRTALFALSEADAAWRRDFPGPGWLKRADVHAEGPGDVVRVGDLAHAREVLADFARRHIPGLIWQEHVGGEEIKFYAVGPAFLKAFWTGTGAAITGSLAAGLSDLSARLAQITGLEVFGGDVILTPDGNLVLIDLNDWPSFSRCLEAAALEIFHHAEERLGL